MWVLEVDVPLLEELLLEEDDVLDAPPPEEVLLEDGLELVLPLDVIELISLFLDGLDSTVVCVPQEQIESKHATTKANNGFPLRIVITS